MRRAAKWLLIAWVAGEWYARGGREVMFGERVEREGPLESFGRWFDLPLNYDAPVGKVDIPVAVKGVTFGHVDELRVREGATDPAGYPTRRLEFHGVFDRTLLDHPINVALAQAGDLGRQAVLAHFAG